jgi:hypothetical protein
LTKDSSWATAALLKAKLTPHAQTLFATRSLHYHEEKEHIAEQFAQLLLRRCKRLIEDRDEPARVLLIMDAGTTLYPFFENIGRECVRSYNNRESWVDHFSIVTNNLAGIDSLMEHACISRESRYAPLAVECHCLPGHPMPIFSGVAGIKTIHAIKSLRTDYANHEFDRIDNVSATTTDVHRRLLIIILTTGNWLRIRRHDPPCPVPLARTSEHFQVKQELINICDEAYIIAPLGKVLFNCAPNEINNALGYDDTQASPDKEPYSEITVTDDQAKRIKLVTTSRIERRLLFPLSQKLKAVLEYVEAHNYDDVINKPIEVMPHVFIPFDRLPNNRWLELEEEFPHRNTRGESFLERFYDIHISNWSAHHGTEENV